MTASRLRADDVVATPAEVAALAALRDATGEADGPMERHCLRVFAIAWRLGERRGAAPDREVLLCAALLHDIGAYIEGHTDPYVSEGRHFAQRFLAPHGWDPGRVRVASTRSSSITTSCPRARAGRRSSCCAAPT